MRTDCRLCGTTPLQSVFFLSATPPANDFRPADRIDEIQETFPLELNLCSNCGHLQLGHVVDPESLFSDYVYVSGTSPSFVAHFDDYAKSVWAMADGQNGSLVVDIGSNDGTLLKSFGALGAEIQGVDPALKIAESAENAGVPTIARFFTIETAHHILKTRGHAQIVTANNVCAHIDDLGAVIDAVATVLAPGGIFVFEVSYLVDVLEKTLFDTIYHEHLDYHALTPLVPFLSSHGLNMFHAERIASHGGSIRVFAAPISAEKSETRILKGLLDAEKELKISEPAIYREFIAKIEQAGSNLSGLLETSRRDGRKVAGYGAPAKATTLMYQFQLNQNDLAYIIDDSPWKQGLYSPGLNIPIVPATHLTQDPVDDLVILAWNFAKPIIENNQQFLDAGGRFIVPLPTLKVESAND